MGANALVALGELEKGLDWANQALAMEPERPGLCVRTGPVRSCFQSRREIVPEKLHNHIGFVSPYLVLYEEFSAWENLIIFSKIRGVSFDQEKVLYYLKQFLLENRKDDLVKTYSSGMKQRLKFVFALMHSPDILIFDEPTSNLDEEGKKVVYKIILEEGKNRIVIVASNESKDLELCNEVLLLENFK